MSFFKSKPYRDKAYLKWVSEQPCSCCGLDDDTTVPHHLIGVGNGVMGGKADDLEAMPLCFTCHSNIHLASSDKQEQYKFVGQTLQAAIKSGYKFKI